MKKLLIVFAFAVIATGANAQAGKTAPKSQAPAKKETAGTQTAPQGYYTHMADGVVLVKGDVAQPMKEDMIKFENGNALLREGTFVFDGGNQKKMLMEGERVDMKGNLMRHDAESIPTQAAPDKTK